MLIRVLLANGRTSELSAMKKILSEYSLLTAGDAAEALRILRAHDEIQLFLLDVNLPDRGACQILEFLKKNEERYRHLRIIVLADPEDLESISRALKLGATDYIRRPIGEDSLKARMSIHTALLIAEKARTEHALTIEMIFEQAPIGIAIAHNSDPRHPEGTEVRINSMYEQITGRTREELIALGWAKITHPDDLQEDLENFNRLQSGEINSYTMFKRVIKPDGSIVWIHLISARLAIPNERFTHICLIEDITERRAIEKAWSESERSKSILLSHLPGLAYRCKYDRDWTMQYVSEGCYSLTGYPPESLLYNRDLSYNDIIFPEYHESLWNEWDRILKDKKPFKFEYEIITADGTKKWVLELGQGIYDEQGNVEALEGIVLDISDRKAMEITLKYNNEHDRWTGLYNRDYLENLLTRDIREKKDSKKAFVGINLSTTQVLVANYGFQYTQNVLKRVAETLRQFCTYKRMLFHTFPNRFVFYVTDYQNRDELLEFSQSIAATLESLLLLERIGGGIGVLEITPGNATDFDRLLRQLLVASEKAMSLIGRDFGIVFYDEALEALVNREIAIIEALGDIANGASSGDELFLQYQPVLNLKTGEISGFEALARLKTEALGPVSPSEFIPIAEKTKLILPIGELVMLDALRFLKKLEERGCDKVYVAINICVIQLLKPDFVSRLFDLISEMQVNPKNITLEITESVFMSDYETINNILAKLRNAGLCIAIDDFGTGYSSLAREKDLNVDYLKIDKQFIDRLLETEPGKAITSDIIAISHKLGHRTIAEGVEHEGQLEYLIRHGCDNIQGYFLSKPIDEKTAFEFLSRHEKKKTFII